MIVELQCPDCGKKHFFDVSLSIKENKNFKNEDEMKQFLIENVRFKGILTREDVLNNL